MEGNHCVTDDGGNHDRDDRTGARLCRSHTPGAFWSEALGYTTVGGAGNYVMLVGEDARLPKLLLQAVDEAKTTKNRMHLDIETPHVDDEVVRLESLGARRLEPDARSEHGSRWVIMADPEGNEFCVCNAGAHPD